MKFTESQLEQAFIELLGKEEITHHLGETIQRSPEEVLIKGDLRTFLMNQYESEEITVSEVESIIRDLEKFLASDLYESNKAIMKMISDGFLLKREEPGKKDLYIQLIDFQGLNKISESLTEKDFEPESIAAEMDWDIKQNRTTTFTKLSTNSKFRATKNVSPMQLFTSTDCLWW